MSDDLALDTRKQADATPQREVRRWLLEIKLAKRREKEYRENAKSIIQKYRGQKAKKNSFNILWSNTEVLRPAIYNSSPKPDIRRRFRSGDLIGKAVSEVMERSLAYCVDAYDLDNCLKNDVLDSLLAGRGLSRVRYVPIIKNAEAEQSAATARSAADVDSSPTEAAPAEAYEGDREEVDYEQALCDHVQWEDFLHGPGQTWEEVQWVAFRCKLDRGDLIEKFGKEIGKEIELNDVSDSELGDKSDQDLKEVFKRAELWEIWDKQGEKVFFVNESYRKSVIYPEGEDGTPPLKLRNFFPVPRPLMMVEDTGSLIPIALYDLYKEQAEELDRISHRINKVINALKVRGVYDSTLSELSELMKGEDNTLVPAEQARAWMNNGGLEKAIWWMPVQQSAVVLKELYAARNEAKQVIYELTGIADILRGATDPNETLGAQQLKAQASTGRLQRMRGEVQRYTRDLIRLLSEVIGDNFSVQTLTQMTGLNFPTAIQKQQIQLHMQAMQQQALPPPQSAPGQAPQPGMPQGQIPPQPNPQLKAMQNALSMPSWEDVMQVMKSGLQREYRVDVETDSTVAQSLNQDMEGLREVLKGLVEFWQGVGPAVMDGALTMDAVKSITMSIVRHARMGLEVEDALESGMQQPQPKPNPMQMKIEYEQQLAQQKQAHDQALEQMQFRHEQLIAQREDQQSQQKMAQEAQFTQQKIQMEASAKQHQAMIDASMEKFKALLDSITKVEVAEITAKATISTEQEDAARQAVQ